MKLFTFVLLVAAFANCGLTVNAQAADFCEDLLENQLESSSQFLPTCECVAGENDAYTLTCQDGCESCNVNQTCGLRSFTQGIGPQGGFDKYSDCFNFTTGPFEGDILCFETSHGGGTAAASQQKKKNLLGNGRTPHSTRALLGDRPRTRAVQHKIDQKSLEAQCRISVNGEDCASCELQFTECGIKGERFYLYANCTNNEIGSIVDECRSEGFDGILLPFFTAFNTGGACQNGTGNVQAAEYCEDLAIQYSLLQSTCECIPNDQGGTYTLSCEENCESCDKGEDCGIRSHTELADPSGFDQEFNDCFEHTQGAFEGDKVCFGSVSTENEMRCIISVNENECKSCEYVSQTCGTLESYYGILADCTNVDEINGIVDECHNEGFESDGVLLPFFTSFEVGKCSLDGNATGDPTDPSEPLPEESCKELMGIYSEFSTCECIAGLDNMTYTLKCQEWCESCNPDSKICGIRSTTEVIDPQVEYAYGECFKYTQGPFKGDEVCTESYYFSNGTEGCRISANGVDCSSCQYQYKICGQQGYQGSFRIADCNNVVEIGAIVDDCTSGGLGDDDILAAHYSAWEVGNCNLTETVETTSQRSEPRETDVEPFEAEPTSGAKCEGRMVVSSVVVAALLFSSLA